MDWYIPLLIFIGRICDVSIGTVRMIFVINGYKWTAAILGFFEVAIWALAVGGLVSYLQNPLAIIAFAGGFATGNLIGITIEQRIAIGRRIVRVITPVGGQKVATRLREKGYRVTDLEGHGAKGPVEISFLIVKRKRLDDALRAVRAIEPAAFVTVERTEQVGDHPMASSTLAKRKWLRGMVRK